MPWPPTVNHWHQPAKIGNFARIIKSAKAREYESRAVAHLADIGIAGKNLNGSLCVELILHPPTLRKYDIDNRTKGIFDALSAAMFWGDDSQVQTLIIKKGEKIPPGKIVVMVSGEAVSVGG